MKRQTLVLSFMIMVLSSFPMAISAQESSSQFSVPQDAVNKILGVRIDDLVNSYPALVPGLANVAANIKSNPQAFFNNGSVEVVHLVFLREIPELQSDRVVLKLTGYVKYKGFSHFENITINYSKGVSKLAEMNISHENSVNLKDAVFKLQVGLVDRKLIIQDEIHDIKFVLPIGVGGFDEGVLNEGKVSLITPRFQNGFIDQRAVISKREKPRYFDGKPFIRLLKGNDLRSDSTAIGFHTEINDSFVRGFDSHGCMRLRVPDLMAVHDLIMDGDEQQTPISVSYRTADPSDHPASKRNKTFKTVLNNGTSASPFFPLDRDNLVQMTYKESGAPMDLLIDQLADNYEDLYSYDTQMQLREQNDRRKNECQAKVMNKQIGSSNKDFDKCLDAGKRKDTAKDKLYRKFMGIDAYTEISLY